MLLDKNSYDDIQSFVDHLKKNQNVIGIVEYGGRTYTDMSPGGDYDLTVIFDEPMSKNFTGVHFHIKDIPIDCMLLSRQDFLSRTPLNGFLLVHLNCKIIYDRANMTSELLQVVRTNWSVQTKLSDSEVALFRFTFRHVLDKLQHRLHHNELYTRFFIHSSVDWFLSCYARIKGWEVGKPKLHLELIQSEERPLFDIISRLYSECCLETQFDLLRQCADYMLQSICGLWMGNEVLFHLLPEGKNDEDEQRRILEILMNWQNNAFGSSAPSVGVQTS